jgi:ATP-dependent DNA ligase
LEWTPDNRLRHPRFVGIRSDKDARDVIREGDPIATCASSNSA